MLSAIGGSENCYVNMRSSNLIYGIGSSKINFFHIVRILGTQFCIISHVKGYKNSLCLLETKIFKAVYICYGGHLIDTVNQSVI